MVSLTEMRMFRQSWRCPVGAIGKSHSEVQSFFEQSEPGSMERIGCQSASLAITDEVTTGLAWVTTFLVPLLLVPTM